MEKFNMQPEECGLLIVDVQGKLANIVYDSEAVIAAIGKLIQSCQILNIDTVLVEQNPQGLGPTSPQIQQHLINRQALVKHSFNALAEQHIKAHILAMNKQHWLVVGIEAHICVYQTVRGLLKEGLQVQVISDGIASRVQANRDLAISNMRNLGAVIASVEMCLYELLGSSQHPRFREVLSIIK